MDGNSPDLVMLFQRKRAGLIHARIRHVCCVSLATLVAWLMAASSQGAEAASQTVEVVAVIEPELSLAIEPETGERIDLGVIASSPTESRVSRPVNVHVRIQSNLGQPYQVTQQLIEPLTNEQGTTVPAGHLLLNASQEGLGRAADRPQAILSSDPLGRSSNTSVSYQLRVPPRQPAGTYRGTILMTVTAQ